MPKLTAEEFKIHKNKLNKERYARLIVKDFNCEICGKKTNEQHYTVHNKSTFHKYEALKKDFEALKNQTINKAYEDLLTKHAELQEEHQNLRKQLKCLGDIISK